MRVIGMPGYITITTRRQTLIIGEAQGRELAVKLVDELQKLADRKKQNLDRIPTVRNADGADDTGHGDPDTRQQADPVPSD